MFLGCRYNVANIFYERCFFYSQLIFILVHNSLVCHHYFFMSSLLYLFLPAAEW